MQPSSQNSDDSDPDTYGGERGKAFRKKQRRLLQSAASGRDTPNMGDVRFSSRRAAKVATYNEDAGLNFSEEEVETTPAYYTYEDEGPAVDVVLNHRLKEGAGTCWLTFSTRATSTDSMSQILPATTSTTSSSTYVASLSRATSTRR